ncbi:MAG: SpoIIE family protein phosphatase [Oscillospiraceae bacterium]|nr:SpoIIE family protein phosphatase [Oscillospiraceae bacterium]
MKKNSPERERFLCITGVLFSAAAGCLLSAASFRGMRLPLSTALAAAVSPVNGVAVLAGSIFTYALTGILVRQPVIICMLVLAVLLRWVTGTQCTPRGAALTGGLAAALSAGIFAAAGLLGSGSILTCISAALTVPLLAFCISAVIRCTTRGCPVCISRADALPCAICLTVLLAAISSAQFFMFRFGVICMGFLILTASKRYAGTGGTFTASLAVCALLLSGTDAACFAAMLPAAGLAAGACSEKRNALLYVMMQTVCGIGAWLCGWTQEAASLWVNIMLGGLLFLCLPAVKLLDMLFCWQDAESALAELTTVRMEFMSHALTGVRKSAERIANMLDAREHAKDPSVGVQERVCGKCRSKATCWEGSGEEIRTRFRNMAQTGLAEPLCIPEGCLRAEQLTEEFTRMKRRNAASRALSARLHESQMMLFSQMRITEELLRRAGQRSGKQYSRELTQYLTAGLEKYGIPYIAAAVSEPRGKRLLVEFYAPEDSAPDPDMLAECITDAVKTPVIYCGTEHAGEAQRLLFRGTGGYAVSTAAAQCAVHEDEPCGDSWDTFSDSDGAVYLVISDGMGSGKHAAVDSRIVISNFRQLVQSGMDCEAAARMINAIMLTKSGDERFATLDVARICTDTAAVTLYKYGAGPTLIRHGERVTVCQAATNPIGILPQAEPYTTVLKLERGDMLFLLSDGLDDALYPFVRQRVAQGGDLQTLTHAVCAKAQRDAYGIPRDDVTVLAANIDFA